MSDFPSNESNFLIEGPAGSLELLTLASKNPSHEVAIICHPHPLHEGTMHNKVVHTLSRAFHHKNIHAVRFNFRGVGKSVGQFGDSVGEVEDLRAVISWCDTVLQRPKLWLAGFSFGAYIAAKVASFSSCQKLFSVAPSVANQPYDQLPPILCPWTVIQGLKDEIISANEVIAWCHAQSHRHPHMTLITLENATHFFHGELIRLREIVENDAA